MLENLDARVNLLESARAGDRSDWLALTKAVGRLDHWVSQSDQIESISTGKPRHYISEREQPTAPACSPEQRDIELAEMRRAKQQGGGYL